MITKGISTGVILICIMANSALAQPSTQTKGQLQQEPVTLSFMQQPKNRLNIQAKTIDNLLAEFENDPTPLFSFPLKNKINKFRNNLSSLSPLSQAIIKKYNKLDTSIHQIRNTIKKPHSKTMSGQFNVKSEAEKNGLDPENITKIRGSMIMLNQGGTCLEIDNDNQGGIKVTKGVNCNNRQEQQWLQDARHALHSIKKPGYCLQTNSKNEIKLLPCQVNNIMQSWYKRKHSSLRNANDLCLEAVKNTVKLSQCTKSSKQSWGHLTLNLNPLLAMLNKNELSYFINKK